MPSPRSLAAAAAAAALVALPSSLASRVLDLDLAHPPTYGLGDPVRDAFDCEARQLALEYAAYLQPWRPASAFQGIADALNGSPEKAAGCVVDVAAALAKRDANTTASAARGAPSAANPTLRTRTRDTIVPPSNGGLTLFVDAAKGSDANNGTQDFPFATIGVALNAARADPGWDTIVLRAGTYRPGTLALSSADSGLTIQAFPGEEVWISGAYPLTGVTWAAVDVNASAWTMQDNANAVYAQVPSPQVWYYGTTPTALACQTACQANNTAGGGCDVWTWHDVNQTGYQYDCFFRSDGVWQPAYEVGHVSGRLAPGPNVWSASLAGTPFAANGVPGLRENGARMVRARYPNANPETAFFFVPNAITAASWTPQTSPRNPDTEYNLPTSYLNRNTSVSMFQTWTGGVGGTCDRFSPPGGYWCSTKVQGGGSQIYFMPTAFQMPNTTLPNWPYADPSTAVVQVWRNGHWASWMFEVSSITMDPTTGKLDVELGLGGFQGSRGDDSAGELYIENVREELDFPGEWFYDAAAQTLYYWHNTTAGAPPPSDGTLQIPQDKHLINITGTMADPVTDINIIGIGFRDTAYTYFDAHSLPSGGDWALERSAVVFLEGTERVNVEGCVFERVDGNAVMLSAYNRNATIVDNEFVWLGSSAVAMWGNVEVGASGATEMPPGYGPDGTGGDYPAFNLIARNLCHELGIWEKQSSCYHQAKSAQNTITQNIFYNGPRAMVNFNDGFGGGALLANNLIFNSCRESGDHGPFNSWDRDPSLFLDDTGAVTTQKRMDEIRHNFVVADYNSLGAQDNDDGSSYYYTHENFYVYGSGGQKGDFESHGIIWEKNIIAYPSSGYAIHNGYGGVVGTPGQGMLDGQEHQHIGNLLVTPRDGEYGLPICSGRGKTVMANNTIWSPTGNVSECGMSLSAWQAQGNDPGTTAAAYPATLAEDLIAMARSLLFVL